MTFKHKLSKRLAMLHEMAVAFLVALAVACAPGDRALSPPQADLTAPPIGMTLFQETFEDSAFAARGWYDNTSMVTTTAQHIPGSTAAMEAHFLAGATTPTWGGAARHLFAATPTLYVSYWVKYSSNWVGSGHPYQPTPGPGYKGDWNHVEVYLQLNSVVGGIGVADGVMQYWFNGALVLDRHDILFRTGARPNIQFHQFLTAPYIGDGSPVDQYMWIDDLTVANGRPSVAVAYITVSPPSASMTVGGTSQVTATLKDLSGSVLTGLPIAWTSSNPTVATVTGSGLATAVAAGPSTISATRGGIPRRRARPV